MEAPCHYHPPIPSVGMARSCNELPQIDGIAEQFVVLTDNCPVAIVPTGIYLRKEQVHRIPIMVITPKVEEIVEAVATRLGKEDTGLNYWIEIGQIAIDIINLAWIKRVAIQHQVFVSVRNPAPIGKGNQMAIFVCYGSKWEINYKVI